MLSHPIPELHQGCFPVREPVSPGIHLRVAVMQVGGYRPQLRPHRIAISLNFNQHLPRERAPCLEDRKPMRSHREDRAVNDRLSWRWLFSGARCLGRKA